MTKREKVLEGLSKCELYGQTLQQCLERECPYVEQRGETGECVRFLHEDAMAVMEEAETWRQVAAATDVPRVLTLEEVKEKKPFVLWVEDLDTGALLFRVALIDNDYRDYSLDWCVDITVEENQQDYGKRWRFWDRKPTNEQREAELWK